eukprot:13586314-Ditylum_brightwellii.AAC.1
MNEIAKNSNREVNIHNIGNNHTWTNNLNATNDMQNYFNQDILSWDMRQVASMSFMFKGLYFDQSIHAWYMYRAYHQSEG